jgi:hypothetical protein
LFTKHSVILALGLAVAGCTTYSGRGDWLHKPESQAESKQMNAKGMVPVSVDCRIEGVDSAGRPKLEAKITYAPNPKKDRWKFGIGEAADMHVYEAEAARDKLKLMTRKSMADPKSGKRGSCAIWRGPA